LAKAKAKAKALVRECPRNCSQQGECDTRLGICHCFTGFHGLDCSHNCPNDCSKHGSCLVANPELADETALAGSCHCHRGWRGADCSIRTCVECGFAEGRGRCNENVAQGAPVCECSVGWTGRHCEKRTCPNGCSFHGICHNGICDCDGDWKGKDCSHRRTCLNDCNGQGRCHHGRCFCVKGYHGRDCSVADGAGAEGGGEGAVRSVRFKSKRVEKNARTCEPACSNHGKCLPFTDQSGRTDFVCHCENGWVGVTCADRDAPHFGDSDDKARMHILVQQTEKS